MLDALRAQTLKHEHWELLLVDNASASAVGPQVDLTWHVHARTVREEELGLTPARLRGIGDTKGEVLVFVDDDNVLASDYLEVVARQSVELKWIGAWGGQVLPEFEITPPTWLKPYLPLLAINEVPKDQWSNYTSPAATPPCGAGMCVRRAVAVHYRSEARTNPLRLALDRRGTNLSSAGDTDLALTACDLQLGTGRFAALRLTHIIPRERLELGYFLRLVEGVAASQIVVRSLREPLRPPPPPTWVERLREFWRDLHRTPVDRQLCAAERRGIITGYNHVTATHPRRD